MSLHRTGTLIIEDQVDQVVDTKEIWGKLIPISQGLSTQQLADNSILIGRNPDCKVQINDKRLSGKHCEIRKVQNKVTIVDLSTNGTFLKDKKIGKNKQVDLEDNTQIWFLPANKVNPSQTFGFRIQLLFERKQRALKQQQQKIKLEEQLKQKQALMKQQQQKKVQVTKQKQQQNKKATDFASSIKDQITCSFCFQIMFIPVSIQPCNHRFCGACLTTLVQAKKQQCIQCRKDITTAVRDSIFNSIVEDYLKGHKEEKRTDQEEDEARKKNVFGHEPVDIHEMIHGKKKQPPAKTKAVVPDPPVSRARKGRSARLARTTSDLSASDDDDSQKCRQCNHPRNGFQCGSSQIHMGCHTCGKLMANRDDPSLHQSCIICTTNFCNLYFPPCSSTGVKLQLLSQKRNGVKIDAQLLRGNKFEFEAIKNYLLSKKQNSKDVFDHVMKEIQTKKFSYIFDRKIMRVPPIVAKQVPLQADSAVCDLCWKDLWFQMVFFYKTALSTDFPPAIRDRPVCYWGINCRTMDHNLDHARKYSHMLYQTRF